MVPDRPVAPCAGRASGLLPTLGGLAAVALWSATVALARSLSEQVGPITGGAAVYGVASVPALLRFSAVVCVVGPASWRATWTGLSPRYLLGCGSLFVGYMLALFLALGLAQDRRQVLEVGLLNYLWPVLTLLLAVLLLGWCGRWPLIPGVLLGLGGIVLVITQGSDISVQSFAHNVASNPAAYLLGLLAAVAWALYSTLTRRWAGSGAGGVSWFLFATAGTMAVVCLGVDEPRAWNGRAVGEAAFLGLATWLAYQLWDRAMRRGNLVLVAAFSYLTPLFSTVVSCLYLEVIPTSQLWVGCGLLVTGSLLSWSAVADAAETG